MRFRAGRRQPFKLLARNSSWPQKPRLFFDVESRSCLSGLYALVRLHLAPSGGLWVFCPLSNHWLQALSPVHTWHHPSFWRGHSSGSRSSILYPTRFSFWKDQTIFLCVRDIDLIQLWLAGIPCWRNYTYAPMWLYQLQVELSPCGDICAISHNCRAFSAKTKGVQAFYKATCQQWRWPCGTLWVPIYLLARIFCCPLFFMRSQMRTNQNKRYTISRDESNGADPIFIWHHLHRFTFLQVPFLPNLFLWTFKAFFYLWPPNLASRQVIEISWIWLTHWHWKKLHRSPPAKYEFSS